VTSVPSQATFTVGPDGIAVALDTEELGHLDRVADE
jgi:hypothetical protein